MFEIGRGKGHFYKQKRMHFALHFDMQENVLCVTFLFTKIQTLCVTFYFVKKMHFSDTLYIYTLSYSTYT